MKKKGVQFFMGSVLKRGSGNLEDWSWCNSFQSKNWHSMVRCTLQSVFWWDSPMMVRNWSKETQKELGKGSVVVLIRINLVDDKPLD